MKDTKYILNDNTLYDYHRIQEKLTRMAAEGWHLEKFTNLFWKFRRGEPKEVRYEITYSAAASAYNSRPTEAEVELADLCAQAGWTLAASYAQVQIYRNEDPNATPLETDEVQKFENLRRNMIKHFIPQHFWMILLFSVQFLMHGSSTLRDPAARLSSSMLVLVLIGCAGLVIEYGCILVNDLLWLRSAGRAVEVGQTIPPNGFHRKFRWVMGASTVIFLLGLLFLTKPAYALSVLILTPVMLVSTLGTLAITKKLNASRQVNIWVPALVTLVIILASRPMLSAVVTPAETPAELPLTLSQLTGRKGDPLTIGVDSSPLVSYGRYYDFGAMNEIQYTLVDIHCPLFYDMILNDMEQDFIRYSYWGDAIIPDELRELIGADYLRRTTSHLLEDRWFICWEDHILLLYADWTLTEDQIATLVETLKPQ